MPLGTIAARAESAARSRALYGRKEGVLLGRRQLLASCALVAGTLSRDARGDAGDVVAVARWIAGVAPLARSEPTNDWRAYAAAEDLRWKGAQSRIDAMKQLAARELTPLLSPEAPLFYPFGGPDVLHAVALFPMARRIVLVGLEPVGTLPDPSHVPAGYFARLGAALADLHRLGFLRTQEMASDFQRDGVLAALVGSVVRLGGTIERVAIAPRTGALPASARIDWRLGEPASLPRRLDYFEADLSNSGLRSMDALVAAIQGLAPHATLLKAAMYLLAEPRFSSLRQTILDGSAVVAQDDTGVPFRAFDARWAIRLFGRYESTIKPYEDRFQPDLRAAYERRGALPLPFGVGYAVDARRSNLLIASKSR